uniref:Ribosomal protein S11 n=1 Tax=Ophirina amphinema TaxID=2108040 RepID=A0A348AYS0_9EUKA|nr:ribosomal protein S11 [Ophirina amphinema]
MSVHCTFNNTIISLIDIKGNVLCWSSGGEVGFKGARRSTAYAAQLATEKVLSHARSINAHSIKIQVSGVGEGKRASIKSVANSGIRVLSIVDVTSLPHNGCRPPLRRQV